MMSEGGKAPTGAVHDQEELHVMFTVCCVIVVCMFVHLSNEMCNVMCTILTIVIICYPL